MFVSICNISHIVSTLLQSIPQRSYKYRTENQRLVVLLLSNRQRKEQLCQCPIRWIVRSSWLPAHHSLPPFLRTKKNIRRKPPGCGFSGMFGFLFLRYHNKIYVRLNRYLLYCSTTRIWLYIKVSRELVSE